MPGFPETQIQTLKFGPYTITNTQANAILSRVFKFPKPGEILNATVVAGTALTGDDTNVLYIGFANATNASAITAIAGTNFATNTDLAANTVTDMVTTTEFTFAANDILAINITGAGGENAMNLDKCYVTIHFVYGSPANTT